MLSADRLAVILLSIISFNVIPLEQFRDYSSSAAFNNSTLSILRRNLNRHKLKLSKEKFLTQVSPNLPIRRDNKPLAAESGKIFIILKFEVKNQDAFVQQHSSQNFTRRQRTIFKKFRHELEELKRSLCNTVNSCFRKTTTQRVY